MSPQELWSAVATIAIAFIGSVLYQTHHFDKRFEMMEKRFDDFKVAVDHRFDDLNHYLEAKFKAIEDRLDRLEHPVGRDR